ncbi:MAG: murC [Bacilli bacterium]|nr:murC [Bacilli bacterium]
MDSVQHVHFIGIGGYGMSAIARVMLDLGYHVTGSDLAEKELTNRLKARGATVFIGHSASNIEGADYVVYSTALTRDNVELTAARDQQIPVLHRSEMLARLINSRTGIAIAGAHGKTTTTSMIAYVMEKNQFDPTYVIGGVLSNMGENAKAGRGSHVIAEADESDRSFLHYYPKIAVVTNIEPDHLENYGGDFQNLISAYAEFLSHVPGSGYVVACSDDAHLTALLPQVSSTVITYGIAQGADLLAETIQFVNRSSKCQVYLRGDRLGEMQLSIPGIHNIQNALAAVAVCMKCGLTFDQIVETLSSFRGAERRFQVVGEVNDILVIDDYAHHPTEIRATIAAAKSTGKRIWAVFQPQRYSRTFHLFDLFAQAFMEADEVVLADIYAPAGEQRIEGVTAQKLAELIEANRGRPVAFLPAKEQVLEHLLRHVRAGDVVLTMGAGDIWKVAHGLADALMDQSHRSSF